MDAKRSTMHVFNHKPLGLRLGSRNGIIYVYQIESKPPQQPTPPTTTTPSPSSKSNTNDSNDTENTKHTPNLSKVAKKLGDASILGNNNNNRNEDIQYKLAKNRHDKLLSLLGRRLLRIQEIDVTLFNLNELSNLILTEKTPLYVTFGERIDQFEKIESDTFNFNLHSTFFKAMFLEPPATYAVMDVQRMTLLFFSLFALDLLWDLDEFFQTIKTKHNLNKQNVTDWIYAQQIIANPNSENINEKLGGFRGGSFLGIPFDNNTREGSEHVVNVWDRVNLAATHNGMCLLVALGDDMSRLDKNGIIDTLKHLQNPETGVFGSMYGGEEDLRFIYCACVISYLLNDWTGVDKGKAINFIKECQRYDGGIAFSDSLEGHGGSTFVAVSSLVAMDALNEINVEALLRWCLLNQGQGYKGRPEKPCDTCYSFWIGAVISLISSFYEKNKMNNNNNSDGECKDNETKNIDELLRHGSNKKFYEMTCKRKNRLFNLTCQSGFGGFSKYPHIIYGDIMHGYMGLAGLTMINSKFDSDKFGGHKEMFPLTSSTVSRTDYVKNTMKQPQQSNN